MSIPREPRQLMINIMYLVLTAMLAMNVSAEIFNAFKVLDKGIVESNRALDFTNAPMPEAIQEAAKAKPSLQVYADKVAPIRTEAKALSEFITSIRDSIISESGGYLVDPESGVPTDNLAGEKNIDVTTRILVDDPQQSGITDGMGEALKNRLIDYRSTIADLIDEEDRERFEPEIAVNVDDELWREAGKASWSHHNFDKMPVQAVIPMINKYVNDVKSTEAAALNYLGKKVGLGKEDIVIGGFTVMSAPEKSYVIKGEPYNADIFLTAAAGPDSGTKVELSVNGSPLRVDAQGNGHYTINTSEIGAKTYVATAKVYNPVTEKTTSYTKEFTYEVGERSVAISPTKMNVFYIGVDNPVDISAAGTNSNTLRASMSGAGGGTIRKVSDGRFVVNVSKPTPKNEYAKVNVTADGLSTSRDFRVKRIPDPVPQLSGKKSGAISSGEFRLQNGLFAVLENFDFEADCSIKSYKLVRVPKRGDAIVSFNEGGRYTPESLKLIQKAVASDKFYYENITCQCPGDTRPRKLGLTLFRII